ncbi:MAG: hypothetical protein CVU74_08335, partial [Deltaproteobacteria bacterium HGW-Deltaproteobacteria-9]
MEALRIDLQLHMPGNPRAKGAIEGLMHYINTFESGLKFQRPSGLDELNRWALDWCIWVNAEKKMRGVAPRSNMWSNITAQQLRLCPEEELYRLLIKEPTITRIADGSRLISVDNRHYQIPDSMAAGQKVNVVRHPYEYPNVEVHFNGNVWLCEPIPEDIYGRVSNGTPYGEYKTPKYTETQKAKTEMEGKAESWGITWKGTGDKRMVAPIDNKLLVADLEGLAIAPEGDNGGYLVASSQGDNAYAVFRLPDMTPVGRFRIAAGTFGSTEETDGIELDNRDFGPDFPGGIFIAQDGVNPPAAQNFKYARWDE